MIKDGQEATEKIIIYTDTLLTTWNEKLEKNGFKQGEKPVVPDPHPCSLRTSDIPTNLLKNDYVEIINTCQRHLCTKGYPHNLIG